MVFPHAKIIVALRDPRDVCLSCFFQHFGLNPAMIKFLDWSSTTANYNKVMSYWLAIKPHLSLSWMEVRYEDTVSDLATQAGRLLQHIGVDWEDAVLSHYKRSSDSYVSTPSYQAVRAPVHKKAIARWKNYPEASLKALADLQPFIDAFGYESA